MIRFVIVSQSNRDRKPQETTVEELTYLFGPNEEHRPIVLLGAGASFSSGVPLAGTMVNEIARWAYLTPEQAETIIDRVVDKYQKEAGQDFSRIVIHKTSMFHEPEIRGFRKCLQKNISHVDMISMRPTGLRLLRKAETEVHRGTIIEVENNRTFLFTSGYVEWWKSYPGPHISGREFRTSKSVHPASGHPFRTSGDVQQADGPVFRSSDEAYPPG